MAGSSPAMTIEKWGALPLPSPSCSALSRASILIDEFPLAGQHAALHKRPMSISAAEDPLASPTIAETLRRRALRQPDRIAFTQLISDSESESVTYAGLDRRAAGIAAWLLARGMHDQRILLVHPSGLDFIAAFFGCLYACAQPVPQTPFLRPRNLQRLAAVAAD